MLTGLTPTQRQPLKRHWRNLETVVQTLPSSDVTELLLFYSADVLESLEADPLIRLHYLKGMTWRVRELVRQSQLDLGIDDLIAALEQALTEVM